MMHGGTITIGGQDVTKEVGSGGFTIDSTNESYSESSATVLSMIGTATATATAVAVTITAVLYC